MNNVLALVLANHDNELLSPLTRSDVTATLTYGGKYRVIDFPLSNCLNSGIRKILVLTHSKSYGLQKHLRDAWSIFNPELGEYITPVPPETTLPAEHATDLQLIKQARYIIERNDIDWLLLLNADQVYRMDYSALLEQHISTRADLTVACINDTANRKTGTKINIDSELNIKPASSMHDGVYSMGIGIAGKKIFLELLDHIDSKHNATDLDTLITQTSTHYNLKAYLFGEESGRVSQDRFYSTINTLDDYYQSNLGLLNTTPNIDLYQSDWPIRSYQQQSPPARTTPDELGNEGIIINSMLSSGCVIAGGSVQHSILSRNVRIGAESFIENSIIFEGVTIGENVQIQNCIIEKNNHIPDNIIIGADLQQDKEKFIIIENGVVVVAENTIFKL